ncbi:hypothetical protein J5N97_014554 [Dioscorea zingiberensis]|uniref:BZIP transcription factor n=1 Tax=Dioscorea zingiberensis TaxID=325984 RepID=A0A9D5HJL7_9LILI|nr:hypothetical protein J5N97_014554 [Dioscorea zingiberensis]
MGVSNSKMEDDKALLLCRERRRFVRQALDGRCSLAVAHVSYIQSLRSTGTALRKFVESDAPAESSLNTSTSATPEPLSLTDKSASQISNVETVESCSPVPSPLGSARIHVNNMKAFRSFTTTIKEKPPTPVIATLQTEVSTPKGTTSLTDEDSTAETPPPPGTPPWDYFELFHPIDNQFSFQDGSDSNLGLDNSSYISRLREEEGIPELEEEGENVSSNGRDDFGSEDDFDQPSTEPLVQMFKNRNEVLDSNPIRDSLSKEKVALGTKQLNQEKLIVTNGMHEPDETAPQPPPKEPSSVVILPIDGREKQHVSANKLAPKDLMSCIWEIEDLFIKASESGKEVPRMLEAYKVNFRPLFAEYKAHRSRASSYLTSCVGWCGEETHLHEEPAANETKYLTWHRSESSFSSSSRNLIGVTSKDDGDNFNDSKLSNRFMNSGSHASTLDRLYAWERKLYDEVKASGVIRREYDAKCRLLRHQESRGESQYKIDKTRAKVKDLHSRVKVSIQRIDSISKKIEELRDTELQPQLEELIEGIAQMWERMLDCHKHQCSIISSASNIGSTKISSRSESYRQSAGLLTFELNSLCSSFIKWISVHKSYLEAINGWLHKCVFPLRHKASRGRKNLEFSPRRDRAPPIFVACRIG